ncbi:xyloglucan endotransglucosylase/hydrolase protein 22 [Artemisia annua]|uniref:Xyloglucan endotransglucosylase/hydrolase n=1 Tax=Artemisia annua TaxID=35608 RepID=A0A2U1PTJ0_ARTAN|nr:xyloglucan endotransglucosylase/hydrolase protein 22 [Artemisia annua]
MSTPSNSTTMLYLLPLIILSCMRFVLAANFHRDFDILWGNGRGSILSNGKIVRLSLDEYSGSGIQTKCPYFFLRIDMQIKLIPGNSAGTVTAFYLASEGDKRDEIDIEFLGNLTDEPYTVHTNIFTKGNGSREQQFHLWFDPTRNFHTYTITWNPFMIVMYVDGTPVRVFKNMESNGVPYLKDMPMRVYLSLWDGDQWATRGGTVKTNWSESPFKAWFRNYKVRGCVWMNGESSCSSGSSNTVKHDWYNLKELDSSSKEMLKLVQHKHMFYSYCNDSSRFPHGFPLECDEK